MRVIEPEPFYLERILRLPEEPVIALAGDSGAGVVELGLDPRLRGSLVHALLEEEGPAADRVAGVAAHFVELSEMQTADVAVDRRVPALTAGQAARPREVGPARAGAVRPGG